MECQWKKKAEVITRRGSGAFFSLGSVQRCKMKSCSTQVHYQPYGIKHGMNDKGFRRDTHLRKKGQKLAELLYPRLFLLFREKKIKESIEKRIKNIAGRELGIKNKVQLLTAVVRQCTQKNRTTFIPEKKQLNVIYC